MYSTAAFPISVTMTLVLYTDGSRPTSRDTIMIDYHHEAQENGQGAMEFAGTDSDTGCDARSSAAGSRPAGDGPTPRAMDGAGVDVTRTAVLGRLVRGDLQLHALVDAGGRLSAIISALS